MIDGWKILRRIVGALMLCISIGSVVAGLILALGLQMFLIVLAASVVFSVFLFGGLMLVFDR